MRRNTGSVYRCGGLTHHQRRSGRKRWLNGETASLLTPDILVGTRISVELILGWLANGWSFGQILASYPHITREDILATLEFAAEMMREDEYIAIHKGFGVVPRSLAFSPRSACCA